MSAVTKMNKMMGEWEEGKGPLKSLSNDLDRRGRGMQEEQTLSQAKGKVGEHLGKIPRLK